MPLCPLGSYRFSVRVEGDRILSPDYPHQTAGGRGTAEYRGRSGELVREKRLDKARGVRRLHWTRSSAERLEGISLGESFQTGQGRDAGGDHGQVPRVAAHSAGVDDAAARAERKSAGMLMRYGGLPWGDPFRISQSLQSWFRGVKRGWSWPRAGF